ncbi:uncharacterized protein F5891DRAFT_1197952 [Suillus fuscotomentosus]|uniref:Uncharacterized protein n=1 Tax=Suillus fuscotomentosus TaxID=1912939 RepID=A0AAD4HD84_9AGAM|nr:uncharacterized protein F5891DRAFT_1197952 [Suillus fuscotomentosus]KAG1890613.1 hypothetical protein F5891DRAFT_1197952 [Suillus fuscotomentosus]
MGPPPAPVTGPGVNLLSPSSSSTVPSYYAATSDSGSGLTSISQSKRKSSALSEGDQSCSKQNWPPSVTATAQQEGSTALTSIAGSLPQIIRGLTISPSDRPPATDLGHAVSLLTQTDGLTADDVMILMDYLSSNLNEAVEAL